MRDSLVRLSGLTDLARESEDGNLSIDWNLSPRIQLIHKFVLEDLPLYDLCCDHGLIGLAPHEKGLVPEVFLVDLSATIIERLRADCKRFLKPNQTRHILCLDAKDLVIAHPKANLVIAGVGEKTIIEILNGIYETRPIDDRLILAPIQSAYQLRKLLYMQGWRLVHEEIYKEKHRYRELMVLERNGGKIEPFGNQMWHGPYGKEYFRVLYQRYQRIRQKSQGRDHFAIEFFDRFIGDLSDSFDKAWNRISSTIP